MNSIYTITVASIDNTDEHPVYSEECSANTVVTYSSDSNHRSAIFTSDILRSCTNSHTGTSASAPLAAGVYALVLEARPDLTWRDLQLLNILSAVPVSLRDSSWSWNAAKRLYSNRFGYGKLDAEAIVHNAKLVELLRPQASFHPGAVYPMGNSARIWGSGTKRVSHVTVSKALVKNANMSGLEHVTVTVDLDYTIRGMLEVFLESPSGTVSQLAAKREFDTSGEGLRKWTFSTMKHWGEPIIGKWKLIIKPVDIVPDGIKIKKAAYGRLNNWKIIFWGESGYGQISTFKKNDKLIRSVRPYNYKISTKGDALMNRRFLFLFLPLVTIGILGMVCCFLHRVRSKSSAGDIDGKYRSLSNDKSDGMPVAGPLPELHPFRATGDVPYEVLSNSPTHFQYGRTPGGGYVPQSHDMGESEFQAAVLPAQESNTSTGVGTPRWEVV